MRTKWTKFILQRGFGMIDSLIALGLLAALMASIVLYNSNSNKRKEAQQLAAQTEAFAKIYAEYMHNAYDILKQMPANTPRVLSPQQVLEWPSAIAQINLYKQTPCVTIVKNPTSGELEAIMYYTGSKDISHSKVSVIRNAALLLGNKGGLLHKGSIRGNAGWYLTEGSIFLRSTSKCNGDLPQTTVAVNIDLMPQWNQNLQPNLSIDKIQDRNNNTLSLPGHLQNTNTAKTNIYFAKNKGIIFDNSDASAPVKLMVTDDGEFTNSPSISLGKNVSTLTADTLQPKQQVRSGTMCLPNEIGKTLLDQGVNDQAVAKVLARNTLVCSENKILCNNGYKTCYLPSQPNTITFQNNVLGVQNVAGIFICPSSVPFITKVVTQNTLLLPVYFNSSLLCSDNNPCNEYNPDTRPIGIIAKTADYQVMVHDVSGDYIQGTINNYSASIGYQLSINKQIDYNAVRRDVCNYFNDEYCNYYSPLEVFIDQKTQIKYYWWRFYFIFSGNYYALPDSRLNAMITSATCSSMPVYTQQ